MNLSHRRISASLSASFIGSIFLISTLDNVVVALLLGVAIGVGYGLTRRLPNRSLLESLMAGAALGVPLWALITVIVQPVLGGQMPQWSAAGLRTVFPALVGWVLYGAILASLTQVLYLLATHFFGEEIEPQTAPAAVKTHILILGGGFAGVTVAEDLEQHFGTDPTVSFTLVSDTNALLFTPMLAEVAGSSLEASHISAPLRTSLRRTTVMRGRVARIDLERHHVYLEGDSDDSHSGGISYDHLVLALGSISNYLGLENVRTNSFDFKTLNDAIRIRHHVIAQFERADREPNAARRQALLTFVVAGGGFAGAELAGALNDFTRGMLSYYPGVQPEELRVVLVHSRDRILPELSDSLAAYALERMSVRGVIFKLNKRVVDARPGAVVLSGDEVIETQTIVWTAGTTPNPLVSTLPLAHDKRGAVLVAPTLAVEGHPGLWALGDCASVPDLVTGTTCPPTAQYALRQAHTLARNIHASVHGRPLQLFRFNVLGVLCVVGHQTACAEIRGVRLSGLFGWLMWRGIYVSKLPGLERKVHVLADWIIELFFPRDIVQTFDVQLRERE